MAGEEAAVEEKKAKSPLMMNIIVSSVIGLISGGLGFGLFAFLPGMLSDDAAEEVVEELPPVYVPFGDVVVNLDEGRLTRYLRISITLQVDAENEMAVTEGVETNRSVLRNWLISYLSDKDMEGIRGAAGQHRLRREIQNQYNLILAPDGLDVVQDVLFEEFTVQ